LVLNRPREGVALAVWPLVQTYTLLVHSPLIDRHALSLIAALSMILGALAFPWAAGGWRLSLRALTSAALALVGTTAYVLGFLPQVQRLPERLNPRSPGGPLLEAAQLVTSQVPPNAFVFTDHNYAAVLAKRVVPPPLADLDDYRARSGWITERERRRAPTLRRAGGGHLAAGP
jgi:hypothetical protein